MKIVNEMKYIQTQAQPFVNNTVISDFQNMRYSQRQTSICVSLSWHNAMLGSADIFTKIRKATKLNHLPLKNFRCFHSGDSQIANVPFFQKYYFCRQNSPVSSSCLAEKSTGKCCNYNGKLFSKFDRNTANVVQDRSSKVFLTYIFDNISVEAIGFS